MNGPPSGPGIVSFSYAQWCIEYPELASSVTSAQGQTYFNRATMYVDNTATSPIQNLFQRTIILNMATAHIAKLFAMIAGQQPRELVGRISNAAEGTVSVATAYQTTPTTNIEAWWSQTEYGASAWAAMLPFRTGFYVPPLCQAANWPYGGFGRPF